MARHLARRAVERQPRAKGVRLTTFPHAELMAQAREYFDKHPELLDQAAETVRNDPKLRTLEQIPVDFTRSLRA